MNVMCCPGRIKNMATLNFTKMQGTGNDFILVDGTRQPINGIEDHARSLCDRRFGIGADQLLVIRTSERADFRMQIFNADGSEVEMCGNGIRCFAKYLRDHGLTQKKVIDVETPAGIIRPSIEGEEIAVDMGEPVLSGPDIPVNMDGEIISERLSADNSEYRITCVSMGNPHCVIRVQDAEAFPVGKVGPIIETHSLFPNRTNVEFIQILSDHAIKMRVWERGAGETLSCGTGACAAAVASALNSWTGRTIQVHLKGGVLNVHWEKTNRVILAGPAQEVFTGQINL